MHGLVDLAIESDVARGGEPESSDQPRTEIGDDVSVQVGHDHHIKLRWVVGQLHADSIDLFLPVLNRRIILGHPLGCLDEQPVAHLHDSSLMAGHDGLPV